MSAGRHPNSRLAALSLPAIAVLELDTAPAALWSVDRKRCILNGAATALLGFSAAEFCADKKLWLARVEARDRDGFLTFWRALYEETRPMGCRYGFLPRGTARAFELQETAQQLLAADGTPVVLSRYTPSLTREGRGLAHKISNHLQAIRGEADLLRLSGTLPQRTYESISRSIDGIHDLTEKIEKV
jgi:PAS domain-containing protein